MSVLWASDPAPAPAPAFVAHTCCGCGGTYFSESRTPGLCLDCRHEAIATFRSDPAMALSCLVDDRVGVAL